MNYWHVVLQGDRPWHYCQGDTPRDALAHAVGAGAILAELSYCEFEVYLIGDTCATRAWIEPADGPDVLARRSDAPELSLRWREP